MPLNSNVIKFFIGSDIIIKDMINIPARQHFDSVIIEYLDSVSKKLFSDAEAKPYPDVITFAFWCRKASIINLEKTIDSNTNRIGRGIVFHIAPSNVAVNFAYSLVVGLLSGNANILRLPSKDFNQVRIICNALKEAMTDNIRPYISLLQYGHDQETNDYLSSICDVRIIWGGDETIKTIRKSSLKPRATEITFADRHSICVINADEYLKAEDKKLIAQGFYNDTYLTDQNACTSPRIVIWMGDDIAEAQKNFWEYLSNIIKNRYELKPVQSVSKFTNFCKQAASGKEVHLADYKDNYILRVSVDELYDGLMHYKGNSGYFMEYKAKAMDEILPLCNSQCQTLSYYGFNSKEISKFFLSRCPRGIDRIVPIGKTMDFSLIWDGYDLITNLTRIISVS